MLVKFNAKNMKLWQDTEKLAELKINQRFSRFFTDENAVVNVKASDERIGYKVELTTAYLGQQLRAEVTDRQSVIAALDKCLDTMDRQISKCKTKMKKFNRQNVEKMPETFEYEEDNADYTVVREKTYEMKPMTSADAILNMEMLGHSFYMYYDSDRSAYVTCYKRDDGGYGLIVPK